MILPQAGTAVITQSDNGSWYSGETWLCGELARGAVPTCDEGPVRVFGVARSGQAA
jgi:hypothetical protein